MTRTRKSTTRQPRHGFTLIELLVVISIIAVLVSLVAPAVQAARRTARKMQCLSNMRQVGIAMQAFATTNGNLPSLTTDLPINNATNNTCGGTGMMYGVGWPVALLPALDAAAVLTNMKRNAINTATGTNNPSFSVAGVSGATCAATTPPPNDNVWQEAFTCPDDTDSHRIPGGLSFVVNVGFIPDKVFGIGENIADPQGFTTTTGFPSPGTVGGTTIGSPTTPGILQPYLIDWSGNGNYSLDGWVQAGTGGFDSNDQTIATATGVFFRGTAGASSNSITPSLDAISNGDGQTTTLMLTENLQAGPWNGSLGNGAVYDKSGTTGYLYGVNQLGAGLALPVSAAYIPTAITALSPPNFPTTASGALNGSPALWNHISDSLLDNQNYSCMINRNLNAANGTAPRPSSNHNGGVNAIMCDGSGKFLNETIDKYVYTKLFTPRGVSLGEATLDSRGF